MEGSEAEAARITAENARAEGELLRQACDFDGDPDGRGVERQRRALYLDTYPVGNPRLVSQLR